MDAVGQAFEGKRVFVTGHTGCKGSWLSEWLLQLGAEVHGYSLPPPTQPSLFEQLGLAVRVRHRVADVRDAKLLRSAVEEVQPDFIFHLAAQSLVRRSYAEPLDTFATNTLGTANLLAAFPALKRACAVVVVTSDKCYRNSESGQGHQEDDALGGSDPYSASKAAAEIVTASWRDSFYRPEKILAGQAPPIAIATARAGNVIGGGDWAVDRIVPDCVRALAEKQPIKVRNPAAVRPWQHVLEPLSGYLLLAAEMKKVVEARSDRLAGLCSGFNFGPKTADHRTVRELVEELLKHWPGRWEDDSDAAAPREAHLLRLATDKAKRLLNWEPRWNFSEAVARTAAWHRTPAGEIPAFTRTQIVDFVSARR